MKCKIKYDRLQVYLRGDVREQTCVPFASTQTFCKHESYIPAIPHVVQRDLHLRLVFEVRIFLSVVRADCVACCCCTALVLCKFTAL